jgi:HEPN domain-containing protein
MGGMSGLAKAMWRQGVHDLGVARDNRRLGHFDWACVAAAQAAEKALKAVLLASGRPAVPLHDLNRVFDAIVGAGVADAAAKATVQAHLTFLTLAYGFARCPNTATGAAPADLVGEEEAARALAGAEAVLALARALATELEEP